MTRSKVVSALGEVEDPELPLSIVEMGLVYDVRIEEGGSRVVVEMTFTSMGCPAMGMLMGDVKAAVGSVEGVEGVEVVAVWDPPWTVDRLSQEARDVLRVSGVSV